MKYVPNMATWRAPVLVGFAASIGFAALGSFAVLGCGKVDDTDGGGAGSGASSGSGGGGAAGAGGQNGTAGSGGGGPSEADCPAWEAWDPAVREGVSLATGEPSPGPATWSSVTQVYIEEAASLAGVGCLTALESLQARRSSFSDASVLASLPLTSLLVESDALTTLADIAELETLTTVAFWNTPIDDLELLGELSSLDVLTLENVPAFDLAALAELSSLRYVDLLDVAVTSVAPLGTLPNLATLTLDGTEVSDISPLTQLGDSFESLTVRESPLRDESFTEDIPTLLAQGRCVEWTDQEGQLQQQPASCFPTK